MLCEDIKKIIPEEGWKKTSQIYPEKNMDKILDFFKQMS